MKEFWKRLWQQPRHRWMLGVPVGGALMMMLGAAALGTVNFVVHKTSSTEFCFSCHSHEANIRTEYESSSHFSNANGTRVSCAACHLPEDDWFDLMTTKIVVSMDVIPELTGKVDTPEKWEAHRAAMAEKVWAEYRDNDSRYCRNCHDPAAMDLALQSSKAAKAHQISNANGKTCIDCHKGLAHKLPKAMKADIEKAQDGKDA
jgi:nitrate/TMAO reductase-like tetraheme cytochrome c subunit